MFPKYDNLKRRALELIGEGKIPSKPTRTQRIDIAYGNSKIENDAITRDIVERVADEHA